MAWLTMFAFTIASNHKLVVDQPTGTGLERHFANPCVAIHELQAIGMLGIPITKLGAIPSQRNRLTGPGFIAIELEHPNNRPLDAPAKHTDHTSGFSRHHDLGKTALLNRD